jgi:hypothetical protein
MPLTLPCVLVRFSIELLVALVCIVQSKVYPVTCLDGRSRGIALLFLNFGTRWGGGLTLRPGRITPGNDLVSIA